MTDLGPTVRIRVIHDNAPPRDAGPGQDWVLGLDRKDGALTFADPLPNGLIAFDTEARVRLRDGALNFLGDHIFGPIEDRMLRIGWKHVPPGPGWINRINVRLSPVTIDMVREAQNRGGRLECSAVGRLPYDGLLPDWMVVA